MAVLNPLPNNGSQTERAIRAWLIAATADNAAADKFTIHEIFTTNDPRTRNEVAAVISILASRSTHEPEFSGNEVWEVRIQAQFPSTVQHGQSNPDLNRLTIDRKIGMVEAAMTQSDGGEDYNVTRDGITSAGRALKTTGSTQDKANNSDMADFTCLFVRYTGAERGHRADGHGGVDSDYWVESRNYRVTCCPANVD